MSDIPFQRYAGNVDGVSARMTAIIAASDERGGPLTDDEVAEYEALETELQTFQRDATTRARHQAYMTPVGDRGVVTATAETSPAMQAFDRYIRTGQSDGTLQFAQGEGVPAAGGYLVPDEFRAKIIERRRTYGGFMNAAENITTSTGAPLSWPTLDDNVDAEIVAEHATGVAGADIVFGTATLGAYKYMSLGAGNLPLRVSVELLQDAAFDVQALISRILGNRIARKMGKDFVVGTGVGMPLGIMAAAGTAFAPTYAGLLGATHAIDPEYRANAKWLMNDASIAVLEGLLDGSNRPLLQRSADSSIADRVSSGYLLGYPVIIDQAVPNIGVGNEWAAFGDFEAAYIVRHVKDVTLVVDPYGRAANGEVQFTAWARADGTIQDPNAFVRLTGS